MKKKGICAILTALLLSPSGIIFAEDYGNLYEGIDEGICRVSSPGIPSYRISIEETGGTGDGIFLNTDAFRSAIDSLAARGGGVRDIFVTGCTFLGTDVGFRFKSTRGRGGVVENIWLQNTVMKDIIAAAITFNLFYEGKAETEVTASSPGQATFPVDETTPVFRDIRIRNIKCNGAGEAMLFRGLPEMPISGIELRDIDITATKGATFINCREPLQENVSIKTTEVTEMR